MEATDVGLLIVRITLGVIFFAHGVKHARGRAKTTRWFASIGFRNPGFQWFMSTATEIGVGVLMIAGLFTGLASAGIVGIMFVAFWTVHRAAGFFITAFMREGVEVEGWEYVFALAAVAAGIAVTGPGAISLDQALGLAEALDGLVGLAVAALGVAAGFGLIVTFWNPALDTADR